MCIFCQYPKCWQWFSVCFFLQKNNIKILLISYLCYVHLAHMYCSQSASGHYPCVHFCSLITICVSEMFSRNYCTVFFFIYIIKTLVNFVHDEMPDSIDKSTAGIMLLLFMSRLCSHSTGVSAVSQTQKYLFLQWWYFWTMVWQEKTEWVVFLSAHSASHFIS